MISHSPQIKCHSNFIRNFGLRTAAIPLFHPSSPHENQQIVLHLFPKDLVFTSSSSSKGCKLGSIMLVTGGYCTMLIEFRSLLSVHFQKTICVKCFPAWNQHIIFSIRKRRSYNPSHHINLPLSMEVARLLGHRSKW